MINEMTIHHDTETMDLKITVGIEKNTRIFSETAGRKEMFERLSDHLDKAIIQFIKREAKRL